MNNKVLKITKEDAKVSENFKNKNLAFARLLDLISTLSFEF